MNPFGLPRVKICAVCYRFALSFVGRENAEVKCGRSTDVISSVEIITEPQRDKIRDLYRLMS